MGDTLYGGGGGARDEPGGGGAFLKAAEVDAAREGGAATLKLDPPEAAEDVVATELARPIFVWPLCARCCCTSLADRTINRLSLVRIGNQLTNRNDAFND